MANFIRVETESRSDLAGQRWSLGGGNDDLLGVSLDGYIDARGRFRTDDGQWLARGVDLDALQRWRMQRAGLSFDDDNDEYPHRDSVGDSEC